MATKTNILCPICDSEDLKEIVRDTTSFEYKKLPYEVSNLAATHCNDCAFEFVPPKQKLSNEALICDEKRKVENFLTSSEIKELRAYLNITQEQAGVLFGGGIHGFSKYERGEVIQSTPMDRLLRVTSVLPEAFDMVFHLSCGYRTEVKSYRKITYAEKGESFESSVDVSNVMPFGPSIKVKQKRKYTIYSGNGTAVA